MKELYIDFDGVILDTITGPFEKTKELNLTTEEEVGKYFSKMDWEKLIEDSPVINDSLNCIQKLIDSNRFYISILTHANSLNEIVHKVHYIRKYFKDITIIPVPKAISKTKMVHTKGAILVDDYTENLKEWESEGGIAIKFSLTPKDRGYTVINKLDQILDIEF